MRMVNVVNQPHPHDVRGGGRAVLRVYRGSRPASGASRRSTSVSQRSCTASSGACRRTSHVHREEPRCP